MRILHVRYASISTKLKQKKMWWLCFNFSKLIDLDSREIKTENL